jgi:hypothetical protein
VETGEEGLRHCVRDAPTCVHTNMHSLTRETYALLHVPRYERCSHMHALSLLEPHTQTHLLSLTHTHTRIHAYALCWFGPQVRMECQAIPRQGNLQPGAAQH